MHFSELYKRFIFLFVGLVIMSFGVGFSVKAGLGTSPISSVPYALSCFTPYTIGMASLIMHAVMISTQILLLRKKYELLQLLQIPVAVLFAYLTDGAMKVLAPIAPESYVGQWILCLMGIILVGIGVSFEIVADVAPLAGEGTILAICRVFPIQFANMKIAFDVSLVITAALLSYIFVGHIEGVREGTLAAALCVGTVVRFFMGTLKPLGTRFFGVDRDEIEA